MFRHIIVFVLLATVAVAQTPQPTYETHYASDSQPKHHNKFVRFITNPVTIAVGVSVLTVAGWHFTHPGYDCYSDAGTEGIYGTYTGTPSGQKGPHHCPTGQVAKAK